MDSNELNELRELVEFLKASDVAEFAWSKGEVTLELKFQGGAPASGLDMAQIAQLMASQPYLAAAPVAPVAMENPGPAIAEEKHHIVKSPIVGTFYESPSPGSPSFVKIGDIVEVGQVLCIVEAMKLMNEIESDAAGEIVERIASTGQPVEYGQALFSIKAR
jgi:acetyl-CoA carboxylase biotin carboxyl carrier protein